MSPEARRLLEKARRALGDAQRAEAILAPTLAARAAYTAALSAARALIYERRGRAAKTHAGARTLFNEIVRAEPALPRELARILGSGYRLKELIDYDDDEQVGMDEAAAAIVAATGLVEAVSQFLSGEDDGTAS